MLSPRSWAHLSPVRMWTPYSPRQSGGTLNDRSTQQGEVGFLGEPQQLVSVPGAAWRQVRVVVTPVVMVVIRADQVVVRGLLVVGDQVFVGEPLEGRTAWSRAPPGRGRPQKLPSTEVCGVDGEGASTGWRQAVGSQGHQKRGAHLSVPSDTTHLQLTS